MLEFLLIFFSYNSVPNNMRQCLVLSHKNNAFFEELKLF